MAVVQLRSHWHTIEKTNSNYRKNSIVLVASAVHLQQRAPPAVTAIRALSMSLFDTAKHCCCRLVWFYVWSHCHCESLVVTAA
jgi:hypothetical protein